VFLWCKAPELKREWGTGGPTEAPKTPAAPATVLRRAGFHRATAQPGGKAKARIDPQARRPALQGATRTPSGVTAGDFDMTTSTKTTSVTTSSALLSVLGMVALGLTLLFAAGHAQSAALHDAAHDVRHATGFPCH